MPDGKLYVYGSYDTRGDVYCSEEYHVVSTPDMEHWTIHDKSLDGNDVPWFNNPAAPKYPGIDWSHPTPFILKMMERDREKGVDMKADLKRKQTSPSRPCCLPRTAWRRTENTISTSACPMTAKASPFPIGRKARSQ